MTDPTATKPKYDQTRIRINEFGARVLRETLKDQREALTTVRRLQRERGIDDRDTFRRINAIERLQNELNRASKEMGWSG